MLLPSCHTQLLLFQFVSSQLAQKRPAIPETWSCSQSAHMYAYDAEGRMSSSDWGSTQYIYDAEGRRVAKYSSYLGNQPTAFYFYDNQGLSVAQLDGTGASVRREIYAGGRHLATYDDQQHTTVYAISDWLGTERARSGVTGVLCQTITSQPFDDAQQVSGSCLPSNNFFTGKERDAESGLDYFGARYYGSTMGRFMSPDSVGTHLGDPQTLNKYSYVANNPLGRIDPDGHDWSDGMQGSSHGGSGSLLDSMRADMNFNFSASLDMNTSVNSTASAQQQVDPASNNFTFTLNSQPMSTLVGPDGSTAEAFSGLGSSKDDPSKTGDANTGPLPQGDYFVVDRPSGGLLGGIRDWLRGDKATWFALYRNDGSIDDTTTVNGTVRGSFRLHPKGPLGISEGCITVDSKSAYVRIAFQLMSARSANIPGTNIRYYGTVDVK